MTSEEKRLKRNAYARVYMRKRMADPERRKKKREHDNAVKKKKYETDLEFREKCKQDRKDGYKNNPDYTKRDTERRKRRYKNDPNYKELVTSYNVKARVELKNCYVMQILKYKDIPITEDNIELQRLQTKLNRTIKQVNKQIEV